MSGDWDILHSALAEANALVAAEAPDEALAAEGRAYVSRIAAASLSTAFLGDRLSRNGLTMPLPVHGGPNPDFMMRHSGIDPDKRYRLSGKMNGSERVGVGLYKFGDNGSPIVTAYTSFEPEDCLPDGAFSLDIAADASGTGGLSIPPDTRLLMIRTLHRGSSEPAYVELAGVEPSRGPALVGGTNDAALAFVAKQLRTNVTQYMKWVRAARKLPNRFAEAPAELSETIIGDAGLQYYLGGFDLEEGEILEVIMPRGLSGYWSLHVYNFWYEHLVTPGADDRNTVAEEDGTTRIYVAPSAPLEYDNCIDTVGRRRGAFLCRISGCEDGASAPQAIKNSL